MITTKTTLSLILSRLVICILRIYHWIFGAVWLGLRGVWRRGWINKIFLIKLRSVYVWKHILIWVHVTLLFILVFVKKSCMGLFGPKIELWGFIIVSWFHLWLWGFRGRSVFVLNLSLILKINLVIIGWLILIRPRVEIVQFLLSKYWFGISWFSSSFLTICCAGATLLYWLTEHRFILILFRSHSYIINLISWCWLVVNLRLTHVWHSETIVLWRLYDELNLVIWGRLLIVLRIWKWICFTFYSILALMIVI